MGNDTTATDFAAIGRLLTNTADRLRINAPAFRSPPRIPGVQRSVTRNRDNTVTVAVTVRNRPLLAVVSDMIDGVVLASGTQGPTAADVYNELWSAAQQWLGSPPGTDRTPHLSVAA
ncbi:MAG: hypothetical protein HKN24_03465 [Acidimicrobiales bacterium]|nr:hypothetical protein [Acidimicrobiales bacterium]